MARRIKKTKGTTSIKAVLNKPVFSKRPGVKTDLRFNVSLVFLIAMLCISAYLFLFFLTENGKAFRDRKIANQAPIAAMVSSPNSVSAAKNQLLDDPALDFKLSIPSQLGEWIYRVGNVKGLTDDSAINQFLKIYVSQKSAGKSASFDDCYKDVLTIRKFTSSEWKNLEKKCEKGDNVICEGAGAKVNEKDGSVWAYTKSGNCPKAAEVSCANVEKIIGSFQFK